jgi:hypothetical protein
MHTTHVRAGTPCPRRCYTQFDAYPNTRTKIYTSKHINEECHLQGCYAVWLL